MSTALLSSQNISKFYQEGNQQTEVLKQVSFSMQPGELVAIVGSSGSGKSTLLHTLGGLDQPSSGSVYQRTIFAKNDTECVGEIA